MADRDDPNRRLDEEVQFHLDQHVEKLVAQGVPPARARREARLRFGGVEGMKDSARDEMRGAWLAGLGRDFRFGARALRRVPGFSVLAVLTLGLGIAASTALFSVVEGVLFRDLPYPDPDRIVRLFALTTDSPDTPARRSGNLAEPNVIDWRDRTHSFSAIAVMSQGGAVPVVAGTEAVMARFTQVSNEFFDVMGVKPERGRGFAPGELREGGPPVVLISAGFRARVFGDQLPSGATLRYGETVFTVIGEMPAGFDYPGGTEIWTPRESFPPSPSRTAHNHQGVARLADGVSLETAVAELSSVSRAMKTEYGDQTWMSDAVAVPLLEQTTEGVRPALRLLFGAAIVLFVIACTNVTNLLLARDAARAPEIALQLAIGASRWRVVRQRLAETLVLCLTGAGFGVLVAGMAMRGLLALDPGTVPRLTQVGLNWPAVAFACLTALVATAVIGLVAALKSAGGDVRAVLADASRSTTGGRGRERAREALVVTQVALTLVLLVGTALLGRSFSALVAVDPGYRTEGGVVLSLVMPWPGTPEAEQRQTQLQERFLAELGRLPGVTDVALASGLPAGSGQYANGRYVEMTSVDEFQSYDDIARLGDRILERAGQAGFRIVGGDYFEAMEIPVLAGRVFESGDTPDAPHVAVVSRSFAEDRWPGRDPIGRFIQFGNMDGNPKGFRVVGVVGDVRELTPEADPGPLFYVDHRQRPRQASRVSVVVVGGNVTAATAQRVLRPLDPTLPLEVAPLATLFDRALSGRRFNLLLITAFGLAALGLAALGTYGLISYLVTQRTREIGIRLALGAEPSAVVRLIVARGVRLAAMGIAIGLGAAFLMTGLVDGLLYAISPTDPASLAWVIAVTAGSVFVASLVPAWRAARISPTETLRG